MDTNYIKRKLQSITRYPEDIYDVKYLVIGISQNTVAPILRQHRGIPYSKLESDINEMIRKNHVANIGIYQGTEYISELCLIMYVG